MEKIQQTHSHQPVFAVSKGQWFIILRWRSGCDHLSPHPWIQTQFSQIVLCSRGSLALTFLWHPHESREIRTFIACNLWNTIDIMIRDSFTFVMQTLSQHRLNEAAQPYCTGSTHQIWRSTWKSDTPIFSFKMFSKELLHQLSTPSSRAVIQYLLSAGPLGMCLTFIGICARNNRVGGTSLAQRAPVPITLPAEIKVAAQEPPLQLWSAADHPLQLGSTERPAIWSLSMQMNAAAVWWGLSVTPNLRAQNTSLLWNLGRR